VRGEGEKGYKVGYWKKKRKIFRGERRGGKGEEKGGIADGETRPTLATGKVSQFISDPGGGEGRNVFALRVRSLWERCGNGKGKEKAQGEMPNERASGVHWNLRGMGKTHFPRKRNTKESGTSEGRWTNGILDRENGCLRGRKIGRSREGAKCKKSGEGLQEGKMKKHRLKNSSKERGRYNPKKKGDGGFSQPGRRMSCRYLNSQKYIDLKKRFRGEECEKGGRKEQKEEKKQQEGGKR